MHGGVIGVTERANYIFKIRSLANNCAKSYLREREDLGFPLLRKNPWKKI